MTDINKVTIPIYELDDEGAILPNPVFHRSWDKLHSRTIEYPFTASKLGDAQRILDVGSVKGGQVWTDWLESLPIDVHVTDYDADDDGIFKNCTFHQADVRHLPMDDNSYDKIFAVSVIEHIGMDVPQVVDANQPEAEELGDVAAFKELLRVLKPNGTIVMTFPYGQLAGTVDDSARIYSAETIRRFNDLAKPITLDYYEYQYNGRNLLFVENQKRTPRWHERLRKQVKNRLQVEVSEGQTVERVKPRHFGMVTWRRIPMQDAKATNLATHIDGIMCGVWQKTAGEA